MTQQPFSAHTGSCLSAGLHGGMKQWLWLRLLHLSLDSPSVSLTLLGQVCACLEGLLWDTHTTKDRRPRTDMVY